MKIEPHIIEFQNGGRPLYSLKKGTKCWKVLLKGGKPHFGQDFEHQTLLQGF